MVQSEVQADTLTRLVRIDELAQLVGIPSRTIRFYNTQGLLPAPIMRGRVAYYEQEHVAVLRIIRELKEQQNLPLDVIRYLLRIRAQQGDIQMNLALKQRFMHSLTAGDQQIELSKEGLAQRCGVTIERIEELLGQDLLFPQKIDNELVFTGDDVLLVKLYQQLEGLGLPIALPALIRFQLKQLVRSEIAAYEQHLLPRWRQEGLSLEQQTEHFERMLTLSDTLISVMHRKLLYQV